MGKGKKKDRIKLPKRLLGVKLPKETRRNINDLLAMAPASAVKPIAAMAVTAVATMLADRLETPLQTMLQRAGLDNGRKPGDGSGDQVVVKH